MFEEKKRRQVICTCLRQIGNNLDPMTDSDKSMREFCLTFGFADKNDETQRWFLTDKGRKYLNGEI